MKYIDKTAARRTGTAFRVVSIAMLIGLMWKWKFFTACDGLYHDLEITDPFFPNFFRSASVLRSVFLGSLATITTAAVSNHHRLRWFASGSTVLLISVACVHQGSYNDVTFVTTWWSSVWCFWLAGQMRGGDQVDVIRRGAWLSRAILSLVLLGGAAGKWTPEYWSGGVIYDIYFVDRDFWVFNWLRESYDTATLREIATWYSRKIILVETLAGLGLWMLPPRPAAVIGTIILVSIGVFSNFLLFSVLASLIGLAAVGLLDTPGLRVEV